jgi:rhamnosyl/mannosyltransferase
LGLKNVDFIGYVSDEDKDALLELCTGFVFPSHLRSEAFGISLLEGAMFAKPLISCEIGTGTSYINICGETGYVVPPADPAALADALTKLWLDPVLSRRMGANALARAEEHFSVQKMNEAYATVYKDLL